MVCTKPAKLLNTPSDKILGTGYWVLGIGKRFLIEQSLKFLVPSPQSLIPSPESSATSYNSFRFTTKGKMAKSEIHPQWYPDAKVYCNGQVVMTVGSTKPELHVDVWSGNHPFYTGTQKIIDTEGRVERFLRKYGMSGSQAAGDQNKK